jgi:hypothetical protein
VHHARRARQWLLFGANLPILFCNGAHPASTSRVPVTTTSGRAPRFETTGLVAANATGARVLANEVPFKGRLEGTATITPGTPPFLPVSIDGTGNATHLGRFTVEIPHVANTTNRTSVGSYEFTAANGDTLTGVFTGQSALTGPGVLSVVETVTITGGTGRFADAAGSFTVERLFNQVTRLTTGSFEGTTSSPGAGTP